jgi:hypothetical protein
MFMLKTSSNLRVIWNMFLFKFLKYVIFDEWEKSSKFDKNVSQDQWSE